MTDNTTQPHTAPADAPQSNAAPHRAVDGHPLPTMNNFSQFLQSLEDGDIHRELSELLPKIAAELTNHMIEFGGKPKGKLSLSVDFKLDGGVFEITAKLDHTLPKPPRGKTVLWTDGKNRFTAANPKQMQMFGRGPVVIDQGPQPTRSV